MKQWGGLDVDYEWQIPLVEHWLRAHGVEPPADMIAAIICGRADGDQFRGRNTFPLFGRPLMVYATLAALNASEVDRVFLTSDDEGMRRIAQLYGVETIDRPPHLAEAVSRSRPSCRTATPRYAGGSARRRKRWWCCSRMPRPSRASRSTRA